MLPSGDRVWVRVQAGQAATSDGASDTSDVGLGQRIAPTAEAPGMSGAPVLELRTGEVIGMLRTSRKLDSNLGGWVVPHLPSPPPASGLGKLNRSRRPLPATRGGLKGEVSDAGLLPLYGQVPTVLLACSRSVGEGRR